MTKNTTAMGIPRVSVTLKTAFKSSQSVEPCASGFTSVNEELGGCTGLLVGWNGSLGFWKLEAASTVSRGITKNKAPSAILTTCRCFQKKYCIYFSKATK